MVELQILDTAGSQELKNSVADFKVRDREGYLVVFDLTSKESVDNIDEHYRRIYGYHNKRDVSVILVGNKADLKDQRVIDYQEAEKMAQDRKSPYIECSALNGENVDEIFNMLVREIKKHNSKKMEIMSSFHENKACCEACRIF